MSAALDTAQDPQRSLFRNALDLAVATASLAERFGHLNLPERRETNRTGSILETVVLTAAATAFIASAFSSQNNNNSSQNNNNQPLQLTLDNVRALGEMVGGNRVPDTLRDELGKFVRSTLALAQSRGVSGGGTSS